MRDRRKWRGFTLLEVLVALAIFATAAISVIRAVTQNINTIGYLEQKTFASLVVDNQVARVMLRTDKITTMSGEEEMAGSTWYWKVTPIETSQALLQAFDVSVSNKKDKAPLVTVRSYVGNK